MLRELTKKKETSILIIIVLLSVVISFLSKTFFTLGNFVDIAKGNSVLGVMALGMLPVLISGGIDLSITGNITLNSVVAGLLLMHTGLGLPLIILICILVGGLIGLINGVIITKLSIPPIVATLGMNSIIMGAVLFQTDGNMITGLPQWFKDFGMISLFKIGYFSVPIQFVFYILAIIITWLLLNYTLLGRGFYAVGGNEISAQRVGYNIDAIKIIIYVFSGMLVGLAAVINTSIVQGVNPNTYYGIEMTVISIAVIGGASTLGGIGTVLGTFLGTVLIALLNNGLILARVPTFWQKIVMGLIIITAISIDVINRNKEKAALVKVDVEE